MTTYFFDDFLKISEQFPKNSEDSPKITKDFQGRTNDVLIIQEQT